MDTSIMHGKCVTYEMFKTRINMIFTAYLIAMHCSSSIIFEISTKQV